MSRVAAMIAFTAALILGSVTPAAEAQVAALPSDATIRDILVDRVDVQHKNTGIVVGIVSPQGRRVIAYGKAGPDNSPSLGGDTVFEIGSVTKIFTSVFLADMARRGEVDLGDPVGKYLPASAGIRSKNGRTLTLTDLATHTSGLPFWPSNIPATREGALSMATYSEDQLFKFLSGFDIPDNIGSNWSYSNIDAGLLGLALGRRAGMPYEALVKSRITAPLGMHSTDIKLSSEMKSRLPVGHDAGLKEAPLWNVPTLAGAGSLYSSVSDLLSFLAAFETDGSDLNRLLPMMLETRRQGPGFKQALGWWIISTGPQDDGILAHDGGTLGFASSIAYDPKSRTGVVVLSNTANGVGDIARHLLRPVIPLTKPAATAPQKIAIQIDAKLLDQYAGDYSVAPSVAFVVSREDDHLTIKIPGLPLLQLRPESERAFFVPENTRVTVTFEVDLQGAVTRLMLRSPDGDTPATRVKRP